MMAGKVITEEDALVLMHKYGPNAQNDPAVCALAKAYAQLVLKRELAGEHWEKLDHTINCLKRALRA